MRKEYDLRNLKVKRRGIPAEVKTSDTRKPETNEPETSRKPVSGYARRVQR